MEHGHVQAVGAQLASVSATWYTWLEQGRGGSPSAAVLEQVATALRLTAAEREHLFLLALHRPPEARIQEGRGVTPRLQRMLDSMEFTPAIVKTSSWDVVAWNLAAAAVLTDYGALSPRDRNLLRMMFCNPEVRARNIHWESHARATVANFRLETARAGFTEGARALVEELSRTSPEFASMWLDQDVGRYGEGTKQLVHPVAGLITMEYSAFAVEEQPGLGLLIFSPATSADRERLRSLLVGSRVAALPV